MRTGPLQSAPQGAAVGVSREEGPGTIGWRWKVRRGDKEESEVRTGLSPWSHGAELRSSEPRPRQWREDIRRRQRQKQTITSAYGGDQ